MSGKHTALSVSASKEAALYFDNVAPFCVFAEAIAGAKKGSSPTWEGLHESLESASSVLEELVPANLRDSAEFSAAWQDVEIVATYLFAKPLIDKFNLASTLGYLKPSEFEDLWGTLHRRLQPLMSRFGLYGLPVVTPEGIVADDPAGDDFVITLRGLSLIDSARASWDQIDEFRKDREAVAQLRKLRLFAADHYQNRDKAFIEDDLLSRIDAYHQQVRRWGFDTTHAALGMLLSSRSIASGLGGALAAALFGAPSLAAVSAVSGTVIELGQIALEVSRRRCELRNALQDNPVSYIVRAQSALKPDA